MADTTLPGLLATGDHASRPAAGDVGSGALYSCTTHGLVYQSDGTSWTTWATLGDAVTEILDLPTAETDDTLVLAPDGAGGVEFRAEAGGGGGGSSYPPGSPDAPPGSPNAADDEFTTTDTSDPISGWTSLGTPDHICSNSDAASHLHIRDGLTGSDSLVGVYKAIPSTPFTMTAKISDVNLRQNYNLVGLSIMEASPGKIETLEPTFNGNFRLLIHAWTNRTTSGSTAGSYDDKLIVTKPPYYLRIKVNTTTSVDYLWSHNGLAWTTLQSARNPGFTIGAIGLVVDSLNTSEKVEAFFDYIRFS